MTRFHMARRGDPESVPWLSECDRCSLLRLEPHPEFAVWAVDVAQHLRYHHDIVLIEPTEE